MIKIDGVIITTHKNPTCVAQAIRPDNLSSMTTIATEKGVKTLINGKHLRSVIASVDDYLTNLAIAEEICSFVSH
ncbi:MAG: KEOPS complex subunit Pcc1 [Methanoregulaceae archaeon]|jgi:hypothetical protein